MGDSLVDTTNFPIYAVNVLSENHFMIAGGGGASKTGIPNAFVSGSITSYSERLPGCIPRFLLCRDLFLRETP